MASKLTKVKTPVKAIGQESVGWPTVLAGLKNELVRLKRLIPIVERKIARGEPWPRDSHA